MSQKFPDLETAQGMYDDLARRFGEMCNDLWGLLDPDNPTGWPYPALAIGGVMEDFEEMKSLLKEFVEMPAHAYKRGREGMCLLCLSVEHKEDCIFARAKKLLEE
jgi:hypothetical protein